MNNSTLSRKVTTEVLLGVSFLSFLFLLTMSMFSFDLTADDAESLLEVVYALGAANVLRLTLLGLGYITLGIGVVNMLQDVKHHRASHTSWVLLGGTFVIILLPYLIWQA